MKGERTSRISGKVILGGEHAVVYGVPALAMPIEQGLEIRVARSSEEGPLAMTFDNGETEVRAHGTGAPLQQMLHFLQTKFEDVFHGCLIRVASELPTSSGLGSSAALGVGLLRMAHEERGHAPDNEQLFTEAMALETFFHGNPSGVDHASIIAETLIRFEKDGSSVPWSAVALPRLPTVVVAFAGKHQGTESAVSALQHRAALNPKWFQDALQKVDGIVRQLEKALIAADWATAGRLMNANHQVLCDFGVSTEALNRLCALAREAGAWGAKLTGAGCGGAMIALCDGSNANAVRQALGKFATVL